MLKRPNLSVARRIFLGFAVTLSLLIAAASVSVTRFNDAADRFIDYIALQNGASELAQLQVELLEGSFQRAHFLETKEVGYGQEAIGHIWAVESALRIQAAEPQEIGSSASITDLADKVAVIGLEMERELEAANAVFAAERVLSDRVDQLTEMEAALNETLRGTTDFLAMNSATEVTMISGAVASQLKNVLADFDLDGVFQVRRSLSRSVENLRLSIDSMGNAIPGTTMLVVRDIYETLGLIEGEYAALATAVEQQMQIDAGAIQTELGGLNMGLENIILTKQVALDDAGQQGQAVSLSTRNQVLFLSIMAVLLGVIAAFMVQRSVVGPLSGLTRAIQAIARGDEDIDLPVRRVDEFGSILDGVDAIQDAAREASSFKQAMESSGAMVMVADAEHRIHFLSRALSDHFLKSEQEIRKSLPDFRADQVIGSTIDAFHQDMQEQRAMLDKLEHRHHAKIALGRARFDVMFSPVFSKSGTRVGSVVEWADVTEQLAMQQDIDGVIRGAIAGDFTQRVEAKAEGAILTRMGNNVNTLLGAFEDGISSLQSTIGQMAEGDLAVRMDGEYQGAFEILQTDLNRTVARLEELVSDIQITSQEINSNTVTIAEDARSLSQRTESQAASLEETAATMEEMSSTIRNNAENAQTATGLAATTEHRADEGGAVVRDAVTAMARIEESSEKMSQIIAVIDSIAFQTNLLALNAAVEAARAGDAGKGFAVVASEVRTLAQRSGEAAKDIKELIQFSSTHVTEGVALVHKTGDALGAIIDSIGKVNSAITDITAMSKEQATGVDEISSALSEMDGMTQKNAAMAEQSASRAGLLADKANALTELVRFFRTGKETAKSTFPEESSVPKAPKPTLSRETDPVLRLPYDGNAALDPSWKEF